MLGQTQPQFVRRYSLFIRSVRLARRGQEASEQGGGWKAAIFLGQKYDLSSRKTSSMKVLLICSSTPRESCMSILYLV